MFSSATREKSEKRRLTLQFKQCKESNGAGEDNQGHHENQKKVANNIGFRP